MGKKLTHADYESKLLDAEIDFFPVEEYKTYNEPIKHECLRGHTFMATPQQILKNVNSCDICAHRDKPKPDRYVEKLKEFDIDLIPLEAYINAATSIKHKCPRGHTWKAKPNNILAGYGCPDCARKGVYNETFFAKYPDKAKEPGLLYCVVLVNKATDERVCIKLGITKGTSFRDVQRRAGGFKGYEYRLQKLVKGTLEQVYHLEQRLHQQWAHKQYISDWAFGGHTELFELDNEIIKSVPATI